MTPEEDLVRALADWRYARSAPLQRDWPERFHWLFQPGIAGFGLGAKATSPCLSIELRHKLPATALRASQLIPRRIVVGSVELETDIEEIKGPIRLQAADMIRPLQPGAMAGIVDGDSGTIGAFVQNRGGGATLMLSCSHVLARSGQFGKDFSELTEAERTILQPIENGDARVGLLTKDFTTLLPDSRGSNSEDLALAEVDPDVDLSPFQRQGGRLIQTDASRVPNAVRVGVKTVLLGGVSGPADGHITKIAATFLATHFPVLGSVRYTGVVKYETHSLPGDSGGAVVDQNDCLLGIHVGKEESSNTGYFIPIANYMSSHQLEVLMQIPGGHQ